VTVDGFDGVAVYGHDVFESVGFADLGVLLVELADEGVDAGAVDLGIDSIGVVLRHDGS